MLEALFSVSSNTYQYACMHTHLHTEWILSTLLCQWRGTWWDCENAPSGRSYSGHADKGGHCMAGPQNLIHPRRHTHTHLHKRTLRLMAKCCRTMQVPVYVNSDILRAMIMYMRTCKHFCISQYVETAFWTPIRKCVYHKCWEILWLMSTCWYKCGHK